MLRMRFNALRYYMALSYAVEYERFGIIDILMGHEATMPRE